MDLKRIKEVSKEYQIPIGAVIDMILSLDDPNIESDFALSLYGNGYTSTFSKKGLELTESGETIVTQAIMKFQDGQYLSPE